MVMTATDLIYTRTYDTLLKVQVAERLAVIASQRGIRRLARDLGYAPATIYSVVHGRRRPSLVLALAVLGYRHTQDTEDTVVSDSIV